jgi:hypothetical protein
MRSKYPGICYRCGKEVKVGEGHFERYQGGWRVQHAECAIEHRRAKFEGAKQRSRRQIIKN